MTLIQLRYLIAIVDADLNISVAATKVHATQPGLSKQLKQLEDELNFQIFIRKGKALDRISDGGAEVIERARAILNEVENIRAAAANHRNESRGQLRIAATTTQSRVALAVAISRLRTLYPLVATRIASVGVADALAMLDRDEADLAIVSTSGERPSGDIALPLFRWNRLLITPADHPLAALSRPVTLADLAATPLVTYGSALDPDSTVAQVFQASALQPDFTSTSRDSDTIKTLVRGGLGAGLVSEMAIGPTDRDLAQIALPDLFPTEVSWVVLRGDRVQRDYLYELLGVLGPALTREQIRAALDGAFDPRWIDGAPAWATISQVWAAPPLTP